MTELCSQSSLSSLDFPLFRKCVRKSIGSGKMMVEFFSADIEFSVYEKGESMRGCVIHLREVPLLTWRYLNCSAEEDSEMISDASLRAREAFCSPSAAITCRKKWTCQCNINGILTIYFTFALASLAASASAAMALWS